MIPLLLYAQSADLVTFALAAAALGVEGNEYGFFANLVYPHFGMLGIYAGKIIGVASFAYGAFAWRKTWRKFTRLIAVVGIIIGSLGTLSNVASLAVSV